MGAAGAPPVVLLPGTFSDRRTWRRVLGALTPSFSCLLFDPRGTGATVDPGRGFGPDDLAGDVLEVMDRAGLGRAHLVGHSLGAGVALLLAARHPARVHRVVAISPTLHMDAHLLAVMDHWEAMARSDLSASALHLGLVMDAFGAAAFERLVPAVVAEMDRRPLERATILRYAECDRRQDLRSLAGRVDAPVLVVAGAEDALCGPGQAPAVAAAVAGSRLEILDGCGHCPHLEAPADLARLVLGFLGP